MFVHRLFDPTLRGLFVHSPDEGGGGSGGGGDDLDAKVNRIVSARLERFESKLDGKLGERFGAVTKTIEEKLAGIGSSLDEKLKTLTTKPDPKPPEGEGSSDGEGSGADGKPKGPFAARVAEMERQLKAEREQREALNKRLEDQAKEREEEKRRLRQQAIETRKEASRSALISALAGDKYIRDAEKAEALALKLERSGALTFDEQGNAKLTTNRVRFQGEPAEPKDFDITKPEGLATALADWAQTDGAKNWLPAAPAEKKPTQAARPTPRAQQSAQTPAQRAAQQPAGDDVSEDALLESVMERMGGADAVRATILSD